MGGHEFIKRYFDSLGGNEFIKRGCASTSADSEKRNFDSLGGHEFIKRYFDALRNFNVDGKDNQDHSSGDDDMKLLFGGKDDLFKQLSQDKMKHE